MIHALKGIDYRVYRVYIFISNNIFGAIYYKQTKPGVVLSLFDQDYLVEFAI